MNDKNGTLQTHSSDKRASVISSASSNTDGWRSGEDILNSESAPFSFRKIHLPAECYHSEDWRKQKSLLLKAYLHIS
ncbi:hypothetical protein DRN79_05215 [Methanosarcinales archaeon]|nr:MAG: hypothetical protein DRN79_05215 [Methanosarcinales archaeon]